MTVSSVSNVNFSGSKYNKDANGYKKTYIGRVLGTGLGVGHAAVTFRVKKGVSKVGIFANKNKPILSSVIDVLKSIKPEFATTLEKFSKEGLKALESTKLKGVVKYGPPIFAAWAVVGGYIKGAIVDKLINTKRAEKAAQQTEA